MTSSARPAVVAVQAYLDSHADQLLDEYFALVRLASVSADPAHADDVARCAELIASRMVRIGLVDVNVEQTGGHPIVIGRTPWISGAPSFLVYAHYDVQPADPIDEWDHAPFEPVQVGEELRGRGISDDKSAVHMHLAVAEAYLATGALAVNLEFAFEGEEELSSPHFEAWLEQRAGAGDALDGCVVSDTTFLSAETPSLGTGVRGLAYIELDVRTAAADLHSGGYGGAVPNAADALVQILAALKDRQGAITVAGFSAAVRTDDAFRRRMASLPFDEAGWLAGAQLVAGAPVGDRDRSVLERLWLQPSLDINGMWAGYAGAGPKTVIPSHAGAKISCRLVPDQDPAEILRMLDAAVRAATPAWAEVSVTPVSSSWPATASADSRLAKAALRSLELAFGTEPVLQREGGSIPVVGMLAARLPDVPLILLGFSPPDDRAHAPNERMRMWNYLGGLSTLAHLWTQIAQEAINDPVS